MPTDVWTQQHQQQAQYAPRNMQQWPQMGGYGGNYGMQMMGPSSGTFEQMYGSGYTGAGSGFGFPSMTRGGPPMRSQMGGGYQPPQWAQSMVNQTRQAGNQQQRMGGMQDQMHRLTEMQKGAGSSQQADMQSRIAGLQQRMTGLQGRMGDPNAEGADRAGMGWRQERRQAKNQAAAPQQGGYNPQAPGVAPQQQQAQPQQQGAPMYNAQAGRPGHMTGADQLAAQRQAWGQGPNGTMSFTGGTSFFDTPFGNLTTASGGDSRIFKQTGGGEGPNDRLYHFDPNAGWKSMTGSEYRGYGDTQYANPADYMNDPRVGAQRHSFQLLGR
jgi:hypothetical protein